MIINLDPEFQQAHQKIKDVSFYSQLDDLDPSLEKEIKGIILRLGHRLSSSELMRFPHLNFVATVTTGLDHIDQAYCHDHQIQILSLKGEVTFLESIRATPEHTWGLLLSLMRHHHLAFASVQKNEWKRELFYGHELNGKTIGIIGLGRIGKIIAQYATAFGMKIMAFDKEDLSQYHHINSTLEDVLSKSDIITMHLPLEEETTNFISTKEFSLMKKKPYIINTARGKIIDEKALLHALETSLVAGAAVDVLSNETAFINTHAKSDLIEYSKKNSNLIITPHIAGSTYESMARTAQFIEDKIISTFPKLCS
jgi:D-3-phosphoglycerate dehydrogenase